MLRLHIKMPVSNKNLKIFSFLVIPPLLWSGNFIVGSIAAPLIGPFSLSFFRWSIAALIIVAFTYQSLWMHRRIIREQGFKLFVLGLLSVTLFPSLLYWGLNFTNANNAGIIQASMPLGILLLSFAYGIEKPKPLQAGGLYLSILGVLWVVTRGDVLSVLNFKYNLGDIFILGSVVCWAFYSVLLKKWRTGDLPSATLLACQICFGWCACLPLFLIEQATHAPIIWNSTTFWVIAYVGIFPSLISLFFWQQGVTLGGANTASLFIPLLSVFTVILSLIFLRQAPQEYQLIGMVLVITGLAIAFYGSTQKSR